MGERCSDGIKEEALERVIVQGAKCIRYVKPVMRRVKVAIKPFVLVTCAVEDVLPCVEQEAVAVREVNQTGRLP